MKNHYFSVSALALALASPALADTRADELWAEWQAQSALSGQTITADVTQTADGLSIGNVTTLLEQDGVVTRGSIDSIEMVENPDGTVSVILSDTYTMTVSFEVDPGDPPGDIEFVLRHEGLDVTVSGDPGARVYAYSADRITLTDGEVSGGGGTPPEIDVMLDITDLESTYEITGTTGGPMGFASEGTVGGLTLEMDLSPPPPEQGRFKASLAMGSLSSVSSGSFLSLAAFGQATAAMPEGFEVDASLAYASLDLDMSFEEPGEAFAVLYGNQGGALSFGLSEDAIVYDVRAEGMQTRISGSEIPVPVDLAAGATAMSFAIPLIASDAPQDVAVRVAVEDLTIGDAIWGMFDPAAVIPRDPASLILDATGQVQLFVDLATLDQETMDAPPGELRALSVTELRLSAAGAEFTGTADLTFAPGQITPMPVGTAELRLSGGNGLLETLIGGGLVPAQEGAFVRGALAAFTRPGALPDTMETTVEFGADGTISANGIPLQ